MTRRLGNVPAETSSFVGRRRERAQLKRMLTVSRLVTVTGVGGVGKTRTALRVASEVRRAYPDGVWWVDLSELADGDLLAQAVAEALDVHDQTTRPQADVLAGYLADRRLLLVLDTCEHLIDACARLVGALLRAAPGLRVMVTSRQPLGVAGESLLAMTPMAVPSVEGWDDRSLDRYPALELFVERAQAADAGFTLNAVNRAAVTRLCQRLDGIPLAIELAAGRLRAVTPEQMVDRLADRFRLLDGARRAGTPRHETLRAAIGWSYELCTPPERLLWARVSVFAGGFDLAAAERVCADERLPAAGVGDVLSGMVDKSILLRVDEPGGPRYRLLDTIREYGAELLRRAGEEPALRRRHRDHVLRHARRLAERWCGPDQVAWGRWLRREHANLRAALDFCLTDPAEHRAGLELVGALRYFWIACGFAREGRHYLDRFLALDQPPGPHLVAALLASGVVGLAQGDLDTVDACVAECRPLLEPHGDAAAVGWAIFLSAGAAMLRGESDRAVRLADRAADRHLRGGDAGMGVLQALTLESMSLVLTGDLERAIAVTERCRAHSRRYGERWMRSYGDYVRAMAELRRGDTAAAAGHAREALRAKRALRDHIGAAPALDVLATTAMAQGDADRAATLLGIAHQVWHTFGLPQLGSPDLAAARERCEREARAALGDERYDASFVEALSLDFDAAVAYALNGQSRRQATPLPDPAPFWTPLTRRERQVAELVAEGLTNQQIADRLVVVPRTAAAHVEHILTKLDLNNRAQIAAWVTRRRPAEPPAATPRAG